MLENNVSGSRPVKESVSQWACPHYSLQCHFISQMCFYHQALSNIVCHKVSKAPVFVCCKLTRKIDRAFFQPLNQIIPFDNARYKRYVKKL
jgi:hypothetical protein